MMLTDRQKQLIVAIIQEFMKDASPVGSEGLKEIYNLAYSPATIRNELADLVKEGYLYKEHSSSGRAPTTMGWRYYISEVLDEEQFSPVNEAFVRQKVFQYRFSIDRLLKEATQALSEITNYIGVGLVENSYDGLQISPVYLSGTSNILTLKEFQDIELLKNFLAVLESNSLLANVFFKSTIENQVNILVGDELGLKSMRSVATVYSILKIGKFDRVVIGVIGPARMNYSRVIPSIRSVAKSIQEATFGW